MLNCQTKLIDSLLEVYNWFVTGVWTSLSMNRSFGNPLIIMSISKTRNVIGENWNTTKLNADNV